MMGNLGSRLNPEHNNGMDDNEMMMNTGTDIKLCCITLDWEGRVERNVATMVQPLVSRRLTNYGIPSIQTRGRRRSCLTQLVLGFFNVQLSLTLSSIFSSQTHKGGETSGWGCRERERE